MQRSTKRFAVFFLGFLIFLLIFEISLRVVGVYYAQRSESDIKVNLDADVTILSIGDSVTFGIGAPEGMSYPDQLGIMLNEIGTGNKYSVINRGRPAQNTAQLLTRLEGQLETYKPDVVTILIGAQNQSNYFGYQDYLTKKLENQPSLLIRLHNILDHIRIYKFFRLLFHQNVENSPNLPEKAVLPESDEGEVVSLPLESEMAEHLKHLRPEELGDYVDSEAAPGMYPDDTDNNTPECVAGVNFKLNGEYEKALASILGVIKKKEVESACYNVAGTIYSDMGQCDNAMKLFKKGIEKEPGQFQNYEGIGQCYLAQGDLETAIDWFEKGFSAASYDTLYELCYVGLSEAYKHSGNNKRAIGFFSKEMNREPIKDDYLHQLASDYLAMFHNFGKDKDIHDWISADVTEIIALCLRYNARPILQNYPTEWEIAELYRKIARKNNVLFVEQNKSFLPFTHEGELDDEFFVPDGHPNEKGYRIMAENIFNAIMEKNPRNR